MAPKTKYASADRLRTRPVFAGLRGAPPRSTYVVNGRVRSQPSANTARVRRELGLSMRHNDRLCRACHLRIITTESLTTNLRLPRAGGDEVHGGDGVRAWVGGPREGCGASKSPDAPGGSSAALFAKFLAYSRCMRGHGISDFPDPTTSAGGDVAINVNGGPGSDLRKNNPTFRSANQACKSLESRGASETPQQSSQKIAAEVKWAKCMRSNGLPGFPDPNNQGAFDRSKFDESTPAFQSASTACQSLMRAVGPITVNP